MSGDRPVQVYVGHWTDADAQTGCTVILFDRLALAAVEVRGAAPATRETELLGPGRTVQRADAIVLTGGSALGLAAADGVVRSLRAAGRGFPTPAGPVPIVPTAAIYDLSVGTATAPDSDAGARAFAAAGPVQSMARGAVGAGTGARTGTLDGSGIRRQGGIGLGRQAWPGGDVIAIAVVNAFGVVGGREAADPPPNPSQPDPRLSLLSDRAGGGHLGTATTLVTLLVDAPSNHALLQRCLVAAHDGLARMIRPVHTPYDGDVVFSVGLREGPTTPQEWLVAGVAAELATEAAVRDAIRVHESSGT